MESSGTLKETPRQCNTTGKVLEKALFNWTLVQEEKKVKGYIYARIKARS